MPKNLHLVAQVLPNSNLNFEPCLGCLGHHAALKGPQNHSPEEVTFDQCDLMVHFHQPEVLEHSVLN